MVVFGRTARRGGQTPEPAPSLEDVAQESAVIDKKLLGRRRYRDIATTKLFEFFAQQGIIDDDPSTRNEQGFYAVGAIHSYGLEARTTGSGGVLFFDTFDGQKHGYRLVRAYKP